MNNQLSASCQCGAVQFQSSTNPILQLVCHCNDCREATGSPFAKTVFFKSKHCESSGPLSVREFKAESGKRTTRESCASCGSVMFDRSEGFPSLVGVMAERINAPFVFEPVCHVWTRSKQPQIDIPDNVRQYPENITS